MRTVGPVLQNVLSRLFLSAYPDPSGIPLLRPRRNGQLQEEEEGLFLSWLVRQRNTMP